VVNNDSVYKQKSHLAAEHGNENFKDMSMEIISFAVIERPSVNITTGAIAEYSINMSIGSNFVYWPKAEDPFTHALNQSNHPSKKDIVSRDHSYNPLTSLPTSVMLPGGSMLSKIGSGIKSVYNFGQHAIDKIKKVAPAAVTAFNILRTISSIAARKPVMPLSMGKQLMLTSEAIEPRG